MGLCVLGVGMGESGGSGRVGGGYQGARGSPCDE